MASSRFFRRPVQKRSNNSGGRGRISKVYIRFISRKQLAGILVIVAAVVICTGIFGQRYVPVLNSASVEWGLYFRDPGQPPEPPPLGAELLRTYQGLYIADTNQKTVYFTYDLGYEAGYTSAVLDVLRDKGVHAIFFLCGHYADTEDSLVRRMLSEGHSVGNHTSKHKDPTKISIADMQKDISDLQRSFEEKYGFQMQFYRPPGGKFNEQNLVVARESNLHATLWSVAYTDWQRDKTIGAETVIKTVMGRVHNGAIMLFHITSADVPNALPGLIDTLRAQGYTVGEPQDLLSLTGTNPAPAQ